MFTAIGIFFGFYALPVSSDLRHRKSGGRTKGGGRKTPPEGQKKRPLGMGPHAVFSAEFYSPFSGLPYNIFQKIFCSTISPTSVFGRIASIASTARVATLSENNRRSTPFLTANSLGMVLYCPPQKTR